MHFWELYVLLVCVFNLFSLSLVNKRLIYFEAVSVHSLQEHICFGYTVWPNVIS